MEWLQELLDSSTIPIVTAFLLGLLMTISPCPLATNITAIGFIGKECSDPRSIFLRGLLYTLGRVIAYAGLAAILIPLLREGTSIYAIQKMIGKSGEIAIAPVLILIGLFMLFGHKLNLPRFGFNGGGKSLGQRGGWGALLLGILFSLAFCPSSGFFYFGILIPMSVAESGGYMLPVVFAIATGLPVIIAAWVLAYSMNGIGKFYNRVQTFQRWLMRIVAMLFILVGVYYAMMFYL